MKKKSPIKKLNLKRHGFTNAKWRLEERDKAAKAAKSRRENKPVVHLHWLWHRGPKAVDCVILGMSSCGARGLHPAQFTHERDKATCPACRTLAEQRLRHPAPVLATPRGTAAPAGGALPAPTRVGAAPAANRTRGLPNGHGGMRINALLKHNPRKPGTGKHSRMAVLLAHNGKTVGEFLAADGNPETLRNAIKERIVELVS